MDEVRVSPAALISTIPVRHPLWSAGDGPGRPEVWLSGPVLVGLSAVAIAGGTAGGEQGDDQASRVPFRGADSACPLPVSRRVRHGDKRAAVDRHLGGLCEGAQSFVSWVCGRPGVPLEAKDARCTTLQALQWRARIAGT